MEGYPLKMTGFVVGGLLGAAAAIYFSRSNRTFSLASLGSAGQALDSVVEKARSKMMAPDKRPPATGASGSQSAAPGAGLAQVQTMVNKDPALKSEVDQIMKESGNPASPL